MKTMSITEVKRELTRIVDGKEVVLVTRYGKPIGFIVPIGSEIGKNLKKECKNKVY